jgi:hypothetical protein
MNKPFEPLSNMLDKVEVKISKTLFSSVKIGKF